MESYSIFPDFEIWPNDYVHAVYDSHPIGETGDDMKEIQARESILKTTETRSGVKVGYYVPTPESIDSIFKGREAADAGLSVEECATEFDYTHLREYDQETRGGARNMFLAIKEDSGACFYRYMKEKVVMTRVRGVKGGVVGIKGGLRVSKRGFSEEEEKERGVKRGRIAPEDEFQEAE